MVAVSLATRWIVAGINAQHGPPTGRCGDARAEALYDYCTIRATRLEAACFQDFKMVELVGIAAHLHVDTT